MTTAPAPRRGLRITLWVLAAVLMVSAAIYQRLTGPTTPFRGGFDVDGVEYTYRLIRTHETTAGARVELPAPVDNAFTATLQYQRYPTGEPFTDVPFRLEGDRMSATLPVQQAAGKMAYVILVDTGTRQIRIPEAGKTDPIILRYKDPVPLGWLLSHVLFMVATILVGMRAGLAAMAEPDAVRKLTLITFVLMTIGGFLLGPIVQKYAFGAYWTGFPFGTDWTDNKTLVMWLAWAAAAGVMWWRPKAKGLIRAVVVLAAVVMMAVYLVPHSMRGSQLDYSSTNPASSVQSTD